MPNNSPKYRDVYLYDAAKDEMTKVSRGPDGKGGNNNSYYPAISADGQYVAYLSKASNIVAADTKSSQDLYVYNRLNRTTELASVDSGGVQPGVDVYDPSISADGSYVSFHTDGAFDPADAGRTDVYIATESGRDALDQQDSRRRERRSTGRQGDAERRCRYDCVRDESDEYGSSSDPDSFIDIYAAALPSGASAPIGLRSRRDGSIWCRLCVVKLARSRRSRVLQGDAGRSGRRHRDRRIVRGGRTEAGTEHRYRIAAGSSGYAWSDGRRSDRNDIGGARDDAPGRTTANAAGVLGGAQVSWVYPSDPDVVGAKVFWRKTFGAAQFGPTRESVLYPKSVASALVPNLENGQFYEFAVAIVDGDGNRSVSEWVRIKLPAGPAIVRLDVRASDGRPAGSDTPRIADISGDGRYTLFLTEAQGIVPGDDSVNPGDSYTPTTDLYLFDAELGATQLISRTPGGKSANSNSNGGSISDDGRWIVFGSRASNLTETADTNGKWDVFLYNRDVNGNGVYDEEDDTSLTKISTPLANNGQANGDSSGLLLAPTAALSFSARMPSIW
ncbi:PD40 domain-containing protein [Cohnella faecalis]|uniref:Fibronectin type-III domain-containing protein n=1 Tax=Cohnella faecalis TaxID=2315694 RepID=A0A398CK67_9BACL|nr:PD40 domain-containing protein [Cohnella faecalis]RIE00287.1 hypothetical protein D3H35_29380 [Cohnella faecalis]